MRSAGPLWIVVVIALSFAVAGCRSLDRGDPLDVGAPEVGPTPVGGETASDPGPTPSREDDPIGSPARPERSGYGTQVADEIPGTSVASLKIRTGRGSVTIIGDPSARRISAKASISSWAENLGEAERIAREVVVRFASRTTENPALIINEPHLSDNQDYDCNLTVTLPPTVRVSLDNSGGQVTIASLDAGLEVVHVGTKLTITGVKGGVEVNSRGTSAELQELSGRVSIDDGDGSLLVQLVTGEVAITDSSGALQVRFITGNVTARNNPGRPEFVNIDGDLTLVGIVHNNAKVEGVAGKVSYPSGD